MSFQNFCDNSKRKDGQEVFAESGYVIKYSNARGEMFILDARNLSEFITYLRDNFDKVYQAWSKANSRKDSIVEYEEGSYRAIFAAASSDPKLKVISSTGRSQTKPVTQVISKFICFLGGFEYVGVAENSHFDKESISAAVENLPERIEDLDRSVKSGNFRIGVEDLDSSEKILLSKPFLLLAGISGTGKTRFVREQAKTSGQFDETYCLASVRPDWHEPSDLLGYISRLSGDAEYVTTDVLQFIAKAWRAIKDSDLAINVQDIEGYGERLVVSGERDALSQVLPYWLCLDEMNLAPVEQYFADYLSVLETREWCWNGENFTYTSDALLKPATINEVTDKDKLRSELGFASGEYDELWQLICQYGLAIPFNLMVAGTVNMDETTHGFSRKVIDRALSFDFGVFFPNDFNEFFAPESCNKRLSYPILSHASKAELAITCDKGGTQSVAFLSAVNAVLKNTPFELAFRALNELLLAVVCSNPQDDKTLKAVWDDFMMCKVLPRIEGDIDKLTTAGGNNILTELSKTLETQLAPIWQEDKHDTAKQRPDLFREKVDAAASEKELYINCRTQDKLTWMQQRLASAAFTSFWP